MGGGYLVGVRRRYTACRPSVTHARYKYFVDPLPLGILTKLSEIEVLAAAAQSTSTGSAVEGLG
jgi:hypothetical protein